jgi:hypothetical protein
LFGDPRQTSRQLAAEHRQVRRFLIRPPNRHHRNDILPIVPLQHRRGARPAVIG